jgi:hypothetical protein
MTQILNLSMLSTVNDKRKLLHQYQCGFWFIVHCTAVSCVSYISTSVGFRLSFTVLLSLVFLTSVPVREEHRSLCWGDLSLKYDTNIKPEYVEYSERQTKTCTGTDVGNTRDSSTVNDKRT